MDVTPKTPVAEGGPSRFSRSGTGPPPLRGIRMVPIADPVSVFVG